MKQKFVAQTKPKEGCEFLTVIQVAHRYNVHPATIHRWRKSKKSSFPKPIKLGENCTRYRFEDLKEFEAKMAGKP